jgi:UPF0271 protein
MNIDLNCDMGEGMGNERDIIPYVSSISVACGGHAGNSVTMQQTLELAVQHQVATGAHPSYPDPTNFGRKKISIEPAALRASIQHQIKQLQTIAARVGASITHVKPHGALYNEASVDSALAWLLVEAIQEIDCALAVWGPPQSELSNAVKQGGLSFIAEGFADRSYQADGRLTPRSQQGALVTDSHACAQQVLRFIREKKVITLDGQLIPCDVQTICIHGDGAKAIQFAKNNWAVLKKEGIFITPCYGKQ